MIPQDYKGSIEDYLIYLMHVRTYEYAMDKTKEKIVLDFGCGEGYGTKMLASEAKHIIAIDISSETIKAAKEKYQSENITFQLIEPVGDSPLPFADDSFDVVLSFQVIEHIIDDRLYLSEIKRVLRPGGTFLVATPNAESRLLPFQNPWNRFHVREYAPDNLNHLLGEAFDNVSIIGLTLKEPWLAIETNRAKRNKWVLWPITNKLIPLKIRQSMLHLLWNLTNRPRNSSKKQKVEEQLPLLSDTLITDTNIQDCPNLLGMCIKSK